MKVANKEMSVRKLWTSNELLDAVSARKAVSIGKLRGEALRAALSEMRDPELMAFLSNVDVSRVAKIVAVSSIDDIDLLLAIAAGNGPSFVRRNALHRIDDTALMGEQPNPWDLLQPQDAMSRHRGAKPLRRCELLGVISLLSPG